MLGSEILLDLATSPYEDDLAFKEIQSNNLILLSDCHLHSGFNERQIIDFYETLRQQVLLAPDYSDFCIVGDFSDGRDIADKLFSKRIISTQHAEIRKLAQDKNIRLILVTGDHDRKNLFNNLDKSKDYYPVNIKHDLFDIVSDVLLVNIAGRQVLLQHDLTFPSHNKNQRLNYFLKAIEAVTSNNLPLFNQFLSITPPHVKNRKEIAKFLKKIKQDIVLINGHTHAQSLRNYGTKVHVNTGAFLVASKAGKKTVTNISPNEDGTLVIRQGNATQTNKKILTIPPYEQ